MTRPATPRRPEHLPAGRDELESYLAGLVGSELAAPVTAADPVSQPVIRQLVLALGDRNPVYTDAALAAQSVYGAVVAPPTSLQTWTMPPPAAPDGAASRTRRDELMSLLDAAGFTGIVVATMEQTYLRPLRVGDQLTSTLRLAGVSGLKQTALGEGYFLTEALDYTDQHGEGVGEIKRTVLKYRPRTGAQA
jgi:acyl dehydratase